MNSIRSLFKQNIFQKTITYLRQFSSESGSEAQGAKGLVVGVYDRNKKDDAACIELSPAAYKMDESNGGKITKALNGLRGDIGKLGKVTVLSNMSEEYPAIALAGLGQKKVDFNPVEYLDEQAENIRIATGVGARELQRVGVKEIVVEDFSRPDAAAEGATLGAWYYSDKPVSTKISQLKDSGSDQSSDEDWLRGSTKAESQNLVRCLCETPPNFITPSMFAQKARDLLCPYGVMVNARDIRWQKEHHMNALLTLGSTSVEPPVFLSLHYCSDDPSVNPYIITGQGTTFNSGGLCRKDCDRMMEADFASAATILGVFKAVAAMKLPINLKAHIPLYEYMLAGLSMKTMDVTQTHDYVIQTPHTDDFHQLALAEATMHAVKEDSPLYLFSLGTLSPGTKAFVGGTTTVYARCDNMWQHVNYAGAVTGDRMWRMPLFKDYADCIQSKSVDVMNLGKSNPGEPCLIAALLDKLTPACHDFTYMDVTGSSAVANGYTPYLAQGLFTGAPTRALIQLLCHLDYCRKQSNRPGSADKNAASASS